MMLRLRGGRGRWTRGIVVVLVMVVRRRMEKERTGFLIGAEGGIGKGKRGGAV